LQSQKLVRSSRSSSGVSRSDENVVTLESATFADCPDRLRLAVFMAAIAFPAGRMRFVDGYRADPDVCEPEAPVRPCVREG
jgi:hypothetical protein